MIPRRLPRMLSVSVFALVVSLITIHACGRSDALAPPLPGDPPLSLADLTALPSPPLLDLIGKKALTVFWVLGFLDEYLGRRIVDDGDVVERLYCNEHDKLGRFRVMLRRLLDEQRMPDDLREDLIQECLPVIRSMQLARGLNSMYVSREATGMFNPSGGRRREIVALKATHAIFELVGDDERIAYLAGAYYRYGHDGVFSFANAAHKADLIAQLLGEVGLMSIERHTLVAIPNGNTVRFAGSENLRALIAQVMP